MTLGGYLSTCYAHKYPDRVGKLLLVSPVGVPDKPPPDPNPKPKPYLYSLAIALWSNNVTPMSLIRGLGPFGPNLVRGYTSRRFAHLEAGELTDLDNYIYHISAQAGSGEFALARLLDPVH
jgi:cardiolipin-specific phospholipase